MWRAAVAIVINATTTSYETIQSPQWHEVTGLGRRGQQVHHTPLIHTHTQLNDWVCWEKFRPVISNYKITS